jgi:hypothetical protein
VFFFLSLPQVFVFLSFFTKCLSFSLFSPSVCLSQRKKRERQTLGEKREKDKSLGEKRNKDKHLVKKETNQTLGETRDKPNTW